MKYTWRYYFLVIALLLSALCLLWRMIDLNILERNFLLKQSNARVLRFVNIPAYRGMITDRFNQPLAISAQVTSVWVNPQVFSATDKQLSQLAKFVEISPSKIRKCINKNTKREFLYLRRGLAPFIEDKVKALGIAGVFCQREYHRFYPEGEIAAHVIGFTNIDDEGQEGLELAFDSWLRGIPGKKEVVKDRLGYTVSDLAVFQEPRQGHDLVLSLDRRIQYLAYDALKKTLEEYSASSGSVVVLDVKTGEILAMVNCPSYNPNHRPNLHDGRYRNRAITDLFEPGSTIKTFSVANALESGKYSPDTKIDTRPGWINLNGNIIRDEHFSGILSLTQILQRSSDVGVAKVTLTLPPSSLENLLRRVGFGVSTDCGFPGESAGTLISRSNWRLIDLATLSFGYGISVTPLQLAQAYAVIANHGVKRSVTLIKLDEEPKGKQVLGREVADALLVMLQTVLEKGGTGALARVEGFRIAGKTGTAYIAGPNGYDKQHYMADFVGIAPATHPRLVVAVVINDPRGEKHMAGEIAAPLFAKVMGGALRLLDVAPDDLM